MEKSYSLVIEIRNHVNSEVNIRGYVNCVRNHGGIMFIEVRDNSGVIQVTADHEQLKKISSEDIVEIRGIVKLRDESTFNDKDIMGKIELKATDLKVIKYTPQLPFPIDTETNVNFNLRHKFRYLDLRRTRMKTIITTYNNVKQFIRELLLKDDFMEFETPILVGVTSEGARQFLVPSRNYPGKCYALAQSPQIYKQYCMIGGFNRYFQFAKCFRDEDSRSNRLYEFHQLDLEIAFESKEYIVNMLLSIVKSVITKFSNIPLDEKIVHMTYHEAMEKYGSDKPDLRNSVMIHDCTDDFKDSEFDIFRNSINNGSILKGFIINENRSRSFFDNVLKYFKQEHKLLLAYSYFSNDQWIGPIAKFIPDEYREKFGCGIFFLCGSKDIIRKWSNVIRTYIGEVGEFINTSIHCLTVVYDFPLFEMGDNGKWDFSHNPFSKPNIQDISDPSTILSEQYDIVLNGSEIGGGSIRNISPEVFRQMLDIVDASHEEYEAFLQALEFAPPHGGCAFGMERFVQQILMGNGIEINHTSDIQMFGLSPRGTDPLSNAPIFPSKVQLEELGIKYK